MSLEEKKELLRLLKIAELDDGFRNITYGHHTIIRATNIIRESILNHQEEE